MAEERARTMPGPHGRGPRPKLEHPMQTLGRVLKVVGKHYWPHLIVVVVAIFVSVLAMVQGTMFTKTLIDSYIIPLVKTAQAGGTPDFSGLVQAITRVALFYGCGVLASFVQSRVMIYVTQGTLRDLRNDLFEHMQTLPIRYFDTHAHGDIMSIYTNDIDTLRQMISQSLPMLLNCIINVASVLVSMLLLNIPLTALTLAMVAVVLITTKKFSALSGRYFVAQQRDLGSINGFIEEMMEGQKVVKVFCHEDKSVEEFTKRNEKLFQSAQNANTFASMLMPVSAQLGNVSYVLCAIVGGILALEGIGGFTLGGLASFLTFNKSFNMPIAQISMQLNAVIMGLAGADRVFKLLDEVPETDEGDVTLVNVKEGADGQLIETEERTNLWAWKRPQRGDQPIAYRKVEGDVTFDDVDFGYTNEKMVLHNIKLFATPGQKIAFVGSTGAGKTTITNLINRFYDLTGGAIRYDGIPIDHIQKPSLRRSLGIVLQDTHLFSATVLENIRYGRLDATDEDCIAAAKLAGADDFISRLPQGYQTRLAGAGEGLSQGQRQLLAIARAAVADPPAMILDEATSSIDTRTEALVQRGMDALMAGRTTFVIAHRLSTIQNADVIVVLDHGHIIEMGNHDTLIAQKGTYYQLYTGAFELE